jgi:uncharacterized protein (UPF0335 family)
MVNIVGNLSSDMLKQYIDKIENLEAEKAEISAHITDTYADAKSHGMDPKIMRQLIKIRKMKDHERDEQESMLEVYKRALGMASHFDE